MFFLNSQFENKLPYRENFLIKHNIDFEQKWLDCFLVLYFFSINSWKFMSTLCKVINLVIWARHMDKRRRRWHPTPVLLPGKSHGWRSVVGCSPRKVGHDWATSLLLFTFMHWRRKWQPGESPGRGSLVGCHLWGCTESDTTEAT